MLRCKLHKLCQAHLQQSLQGLYSAFSSSYKTFVYYLIHPSKQAHYWHKDDSYEIILLFIPQNRVTSHSEQKLL